MIDWNVSLGVIIQSIVVIGGAILVLGTMRRTITDLEQDVNKIEVDLRDLSKTVAQIAVQDQRLNRLEEDVRELRHGNGFVIPALSRPREDQ